MDQHQQPLPATCQDHQHQSGIDFSKMETDSSQLQQASPTVERTSSDNPHLKLVLELKSPKTAKQQRKILQTLKSNPYLMAAFIKRQSSSEGDHLSQFQEHINQQEWKSDMEELVKALTTTELEDTPVAAVAYVAAEAHSKPSLENPMSFGIQHSSRLHHQDHQASSGVSQGSDEKDAQLNPDPDNDDLLLTELKQANPQETRKLSLQKFIESLVHGYQCRDVNCCLSICQKWKMIDKHIKSCERGINENCLICKQITAYCYDHAKQCQESMCPVPVCAKIKFTMKDQQSHHKFEQTQLLQRLAGLSMSVVLVGPPGFDDGFFRETRKLSLLKFIESLVHGYQCLDVNCCLSICQKWKMIEKHIQICKRGIYEGCLICKQITAYCYDHAKQCQESKCPVPVCTNIKFTMMSQQDRHNFKQTQLLQRLARLSMSGVLPGPPGLDGGFSQGREAALNSFILRMLERPEYQQPPFSQLTSSMPMRSSDGPLPIFRQRGNRFTDLGTPFQQNLQVPPLQAPPFVPLQPVQQPPSEMVGTAYDYEANVDALRQVMEIMKIPRAPDFQQQILYVLDSNPWLKAAFIKQRQVIEQAQLARAPPLYANKEDLRQLLEILKTPRALDQQQQMQHILDRNPQLKAAFTKQRQVYEQARLARAQDQSSVEMYQGQHFGISRFSPSC